MKIFTLISSKTSKPAKRAFLILYHPVISFRKFHSFDIPEKRADNEFPFQFFSAFILCRLDGEGSGETTPVFGIDLRP